MDTPTLREFKDVRINVPWGYVAGRWYGDNKIRPILAIHGWQDNLGTWETLIHLMPQHVGVLCIDLPGHGQSSHLPRGMTYHVVEFAQIIVRIMNEYKWQKVSLIGHSMGSIVGFIFSSLFPHKVDMFVAVDVIRSFPRTNDNKIAHFRKYTHRLFIEDERHELAALQEPPSYTYDELERLLYEGSFKSVELQNCKYILNRSITKSKKYPDKYYFSRDGRLKNYAEFLDTDEMAAEMARRVVNIPYLLIKGRESFHINERSFEVIDILTKQNPHFEFHEVPGTHHVHLNNAKGVAAVLNPFINRHRPAQLVSWSLSEDSISSNKANEGATTRKQKKVHFMQRSKL